MMPLPIRPIDTPHHAHLGVKSELRQTLLQLDMGRKFSGLGTQNPFLTAHLSDIIVDDFDELHLDPYLTSKFPILNSG
jgi:hypothetical protein